jgi:hypothetical protein
VISARLPAAVALTLVLAGCLPIHWSQPLSPAVVGVVRDENGAPSAGIRVGVATEVSGSSCARPAVEATTDAAGAFRLAATERRHRFLFLFPFDPTFQPYRFCGGDADSLRLVYRGDRTWWGKRPDSVVCILEEPLESRMRCYGYYVRDGSGLRHVDSTDVFRTR